MNPTGVCRLCLQSKILQDSHLLPRSFYKVLLSNDGKNPNAIFISPKGGAVLRRQVKDYLLCHDCEERFNNQGERWMLSHCYRESGTFLFREKLLKSMPLLSIGDAHLFSVSKIPDIDHACLVYFAASVFWRAAVHTWELPFSDRLRTDLGAYEESLRLFLLGQLAFPSCMVLHIRVSSATVLLDPCMLPNQQERAGCQLHSFLMSGVGFHLYVGSQIPSHVLRFCTVHSQEKPVFMAPQIDQHVLEIANGRAHAHERLFV